MKYRTRNALSVSLAFHFCFFIAAFYFVMQNQPINSDKANLSVELISLTDETRLKPPQKKISRSFLDAEPEFITAPISISETPPTFSAPTAVINETPRPVLGRSLQVEVEIEDPSSALNLSREDWSETSTAARTLQEADSNLSKTEAASPSGNTQFGTKRSGPATGRRAPQISTLKIGQEASEGNGDGLSAAALAEINEKRKSLPRVPFSQLMETLAEDIIEVSDGDPIDVAFIIDASGSMHDNIKAVAEHLHKMIDIYIASEIDYSLGLTDFWTRKGANVITVRQLTKDFKVYQRVLQAIGIHQDENALDAIFQTAKELRFRPTSTRHFILVTDEPFTSLKGLSLPYTISYCQEFGISVHVLGLPLAEHQTLALETGGKWHIIPEKQRPAVTRNPQSFRTPVNKAAALRSAKWSDVARISSNLLQHSNTAPLDIILFIDSSESMESKVQPLLQELDYLARTLDTGFIDYQMGVVRFRSRASMNIVNVFNPPQTPKQIRKIIELPCQEDETLLDAIAEGMRRLKFRPNALPYFILVTDEPVAGKYSSAAIIQMLEEKGVLVSVIGTYDDFQQQVAHKTRGVWVPIPEGHTANNAYW